MFGRRTAEVNDKLSSLDASIANALCVIARLQERVDVLERAAGDRDMAVISHAEIRRPSILVGDTRVSLEHAVQALADAHDMATVDRHLTLRHHRQGEAHGPAINEW